MQISSLPLGQRKVLNPSELYTRTIHNDAGVDRLDEGFTYICGTAPPAETFPHCVAEVNPTPSQDLTRHFRCLGMLTDS